MLKKCPGSSLLRTPELKIKKCPECGSEIEIFSTDFKASCEQCGFTVYNDLQSCFKWCPHASTCLGEELYQRLKERT